MSWIAQLSENNGIDNQCLGKIYKWASLLAQTERLCLQCRRPQVQTLYQKDVLEKGMATHFSILAWRVPWTEELGVTESQTQ